MAFYEELRMRGYVEGQNLIVEGRNAAGQADQLPALARELVALQPDLIVAPGPQASRAVMDATSTIPIEPAINAALAKRAEALVINADPVRNNPPARLPQLVARTGLPAIYFLRTQAEAGGLMSFGPDFIELSRRAASYVDRILKGEKPGDMAIEQPTKIDLVINLKTAKALGLTIPQALRVSADLIVE